MFIYLFGYNLIQLWSLWLVISNLFLSKIIFLLKCSNFVGFKSKLLNWPFQVLVFNKSMFFHLWILCFFFFFFFTIRLIHDFLFFIFFTLSIYLIMLTLFYVTCVYLEGMIWIFGNMAWRLPAFGDLLFLSFFLIYWRVPQTFFLFLFVILKNKIKIVAIMSLTRY